MYAIPVFKNFINRNKEIDTILDKLENNKDSKL